MSNQHTPTLPIRLEKEGQYIVDNSGYKLLYMNPILDHEEDAKLIVKACNNHGRLVEALEASAAALLQITRLAMEEQDTLDDQDEAMRAFDEAIQLLTELNEE